MLIAHVSDLHLGRDAATDRAAADLARALDDCGAAAVVVSGDVTHHGRLSELARFEALFRRQLESGRMTVVPGNHDRLGDDAGSALMDDARVAAWTRPGLHVVRIDSTGPHNGWLVSSHGHLAPRDLEEVDRALDQAPAGVPVVAVLHHHLLPLREDWWPERLATLVGLPFGAELAAGTHLLDLLRGRCDVVLHGHRHRPSEVVLDATGPRPLRVVNAGSSTELGWIRTFRVAGAGAWTERWMDVQPRARASGDWRPAEGRVAA